MSNSALGAGSSLSAASTSSGNFSDNAADGAFVTSTYSYSPGKFLHADENGVYTADLASIQQQNDGYLPLPVPFNRSPDEAAIPSSVNHITATNLTGSALSMFLLVSGPKTQGVVHPDQLSHSLIPQQTILEHGTTLSVVVNADMYEVVVEGVVVRTFENAGGTLAKAAGTKISITTNRNNLRADVTDNENDPDGQYVDILNETDVQIKAGLSQIDNKFDAAAAQKAKRTKTDQCQNNLGRIVLNPQSALSIPVPGDDFNLIALSQGTPCHSSVRRISHASSTVRLGNEPYVQNANVRGPIGHAFVLTKNQNNAVSAKLVNFKHCIWASNSMVGIMGQYNV